MAGQPETPAPRDELWLDLKRRDLEALRSRLADRSSELDQQAIELIARRTGLDRTAEAVKELRAQVETQKADLAAERDKLAAARAELVRLREGHRGQVEAEGRALAARVGRIEQREHDLEHRIARARDEIVQQRNEARETHAAAQRRAAEVDAAAERLEQERAGWDARLSELLARAGELDRRDAGLDERDQELDGERTALGEGRRELADGQRELTEAREKLRHNLRRLEELRQRILKGQAQLEARRAQLDEHIEGERREIEAGYESRARELAEQSAALDARRGELDAQREAHSDAARRLDARQREHAVRQAALTEQTKKLAAARARLEQQHRQAQETLAAQQREADEALAARQREADEAFATRQRAADETLAVQQGELDALEQRLAQSEQALDQRRAEVDGLADQVQERDTESRARELASEVEEQEVARERAALTRAQQNFDAHRDQRHNEFAEAETLLRRRVEQIEKAEQSALAAPRMWWLRATAYAVVIAAAATAGWLRFEAPMHRGTVELRLETVSHDLARALGEHAALLTSERLVDTWLADVGLREAWTQALRDGRSGANVVPTPPCVAVWIDALRSENAQQIAESVAAAYATHVNGVPAEPRLPAAYADLEARRQQVAAELETARAKHEECRTLLAVLPPAERRDEVLRRVDGLRREHADTLSVHEESRKALALLESDGGAPRGVVDERAVREALGTDAAYQADLDEFAVESRGYRKELSVGMVPLSGQLGRLRESLVALAAGLQAQRDQQLPPAIAAVLEECTSLVGGYQAAVEGVEPRWGQWRRAVETIDVSSDVLELAQEHDAADGAARGLIEDGRKLVSSLREQLDGLNGGSAGATREMVVASTLRSDVHGVEAAVQQAATAAAAVGSSTNFRLDAHETRLRGLRTRLSQRHDWMRMQLQQQAAERSAAQRDADLARTRGQLQRAEQRRSELVVELLDRMDALRGLDGDVLERRKLEADLARAEADTQRLGEQNTYLTAQLDEARRSGPRPDRVRPGPSAGMQVAGRDRTSHAALAGGAAFGGTWLLCVLMLVRNPFRRRRSLADTLAIGESAVAGVLLKVP